MRMLSEGIYILHWAEGGRSLAAVGIMADGTNWYAPVNWTSDDLEKPIVASTDWKKVALAQAISIYIPKVEVYGEITCDE